MAMMMWHRSPPNAHARTCRAMTAEVWQARCASMPARRATPCSRLVSSSVSTAAMRPLTKLAVSPSTMRSSEPCRSIRPVRLIPPSALGPLLPPRYRYRLPSGRDTHGLSRLFFSLYHARFVPLSSSPCGVPPRTHDNIYCPHVTLPAFTLYPSLSSFCVLRLFVAIFIACIPWSSHTPHDTAMHFLFSCSAAYVTSPPLTPFRIFIITPIPTDCYSTALPAIYDSLLSIA